MVALIHTDNPKMPTTYDCLSTRQSLWWKLCALLSGQLAPVPATLTRLPCSHSGRCRPHDPRPTAWANNLDKAHVFLAK